MAKIKGIALTANEPTSTDRIYPRVLLERETERLNDIIPDRRLLGFFQIENPSALFRSPLKDVTHVITKLEMDGNDLLVEADIIETNAGNDLLVMLRNNIPLIFQTHGVGCLSDTEPRMVEDPFQLITINISIFSNITKHRKNLIKLVE